MSGLINGIVKIKVDAELLESKPGAELDLGGEERELRTGWKVYGFTRKIVASGLKATFYWKPGSPVEKIRKLTAGTVTFEGDAGDIYEVTNAVTLKTLKIKDETGEVDVEIGGDPAEAL
jgi:hypothetical protein